MVKREELYELGWHVSSNGYHLISENATLLNKNAIINSALNIDIREFGEAVINREIKQSTTGKVVLQIQKIKNVSAPKNKENSQAAPRMLKLSLTDGHTSCQAVEISSINSLSRSHTPPGSKLLINAAKVSANCILLHPNCCTLLGGRVPALCDKWELAKNVSEHVRSSGGIDGPPPWVNFGEKLITALTKEPSFKSLATKEVKPDDFDIQRQDAINVATTGAVKKVFGGGSKTVPLVGNRKSYNYENRRNRRDFKDRGEEHQKAAPDKISLFTFLEDKLADDSHHKINDTVPSRPREDLLKTRYPPRKVDNYYVNNGGAKFPSRNYNNFSNVESASKNFERLSLDKAPSTRLNYQNKNSNPSGGYNWKVGDLCMAKYWEDSKYYNASIINLTERTCVVQFSEYGNVEEVLKLDCIPITVDSKPMYQNTRNYYKGSSNYHHPKKTYSNY